MIIKSYSKWASIVWLLKKFPSSLIVRVIERVSSFINQALVCSESCLVSADTAQTDITGNRANDIKGKVSRHSLLYDINITAITRRYYSPTLSFWHSGEY